jgi:hypothetical protein
MDKHDPPGGQRIVDRDFVVALSIDINELR